MKKGAMKTIRTVFYAYFVLASAGTVGFIIWAKYQDYNIEKAAIELKKARPTPKKMVTPNETKYLYGQELLDRLKAGGLVVYFRHFATDHTQIGKDETREKHRDITAEELINSCDAQRPLSNYGKLQAKLVNDGLEKNDIPIGQILSSPYCRAYAGATIAFGATPSTHRELIYRTKEYPAAQMAKHIVSVLGQKPESGNTFVMAHRPQMDDIGQIEEGEAFVFEPLGDSKFNLIGRIRPEEWLLSNLDSYALGGSHLQNIRYSKSANLESY